MSPLCLGGRVEGVVNGGVRSGTDSRGTTSQPGFAAELGVNNHTLNPGAGPRWFQVTYFPRPPTPLLMMKKLWCLSWTHLVYSLTVAGVGLNLALSFAVLLFLSEPRGCCCFFCHPSLPSRAVGFWGSSSPISLLLMGDLTSGGSQHVSSRLPPPSLSLSPLC